MIVIFPGQGSQFPGMGKDLARDFLSARKIFAQVNDSVRLNLDKVMGDGTLEDLTPTEVAQPAILSHSAAVLEILENELGFCSALAEGPPTGAALSVLGHSLGEFSALLSLGVFSPAEAAFLVRQRGLAVARCPGGAMLALHRVADQNAQELAEAASLAANECVVVSNFNSPDQTVLSGGFRGIDVAEKLARAHGVRRTTRFPVSAPFHSPLLEQARLELQDLLKSREDRWEKGAPLMGGRKHPSRTYWIPNVTAKPLRTVSVQDLVRLLVEQMVKPVRWRQSIDIASNLASQESIESDVELDVIIPGPGAALGRLLRSHQLPVHRIHVLADSRSVSAFLTERREMGLF